MIRFSWYTNPIFDFFGLFRLFTRLIWIGVWYIYHLGMFRVLFSSALLGPTTQESRRSRWKWRARLFTVVADGSTGNCKNRIWNEAEDLGPWGFTCWKNSTKTQFLRHSWGLTSNYFDLCGYLLYFVCVAAAQTDTRYKRWGATSKDLDPFISLRIGRKSPTLQGTNVSHTKALLKMIFLFPPC